MMLVRLRVEEIDSSSESEDLEPSQDEDSRDNTSSASGTNISPWDESSSFSEDEEVEGAARFCFLVEVEEVEIWAATFLLRSHPFGAFLTLLCTVLHCAQGCLCLGFFNFGSESAKIKLLF